jgi:hypothetical protein
VKVADTIRETGERPLAGFAQWCFEAGEDPFDRIELHAVRREEERFAPARKPIPSSSLAT